MDIANFLSRLDEKSNVEIIIGATLDEKHIIEYTKKKLRYDSYYMH